MLAGGAHVKIGSVEYKLDTSADAPYLQVFESLYSDTQDIIGLDAQTANPNVLLWTQDDFAGGGETKYYNPDIPDSYWYGNNNPRVRGAITSPPDQTGTTVTLTTGSPTEWHVVQTGGYVWAGANRDLYYSADGLAWSQWNSTALFGAGYTIHGITHDGYFPIVWADNGTTVKITKVTSTTTSTAFVSDITATFRTYGAAMLEGKVYFWTGKQLLEFDTTAALPITYRSVTLNANLSNAVYTPFDPAATGTYNAGIAASENSIVFFTAAAGTTHIFEYRYNASTNVFSAKPLWEPAVGFTASHITSSMGVVYVVGDYGDQIGLFGMSLTDRQPYFLSYVGQQYAGSGVSLTIGGIAPSFAAQVILSVSDGTTNRVYVYDAEIDSLTQLDELAVATHGTVYMVRTYKNKRLTFGNKADTTGRIRSWKQDFDTPTGAWEWVGAAYHVGFPMDEKLLFGFQVVCDPSIAAGTVQIYYQIDESGSWVSAGTTSAGVKYTNLDIASGSVKYRILRMRAVGASGARVFSVTARSYVNAQQRTWKLTVLTNDQTDTTRPNNAKWTAAQQRDNLISLATTKNVVTYLDGCRYPDPGHYTTHTVVVENPKVLIKPLSNTFQGAVELVLRDVTP